MRVTFIRFPDHTRAHVLIARDDGVTYRLDSGPAGPELPHDLVHYTVEDALRIPDGIWGSIAGGVVFRSMTHVSGRRPPHAAERSRELIRAHRALLQRAELLGGLCERVAFGALPAAGVPSDLLRPDQLATASEALRVAQARWAALAVGESLVLDWPRYRTIRKSAEMPGPTGQPARSRSRRGRSSGRPTPSVR